MHPARVYSALVATWADTVPGARRPSKRFVGWRRWEPSEICCGEAFPRSIKTHFVPINDAVVGSAKNAKDLQVLPTERLRQPRAFPSVGLSSPTVGFCWPAADAGVHRAKLDGLAANLVAVGHPAGYRHELVVGGDD